MRWNPINEYPMLEGFATNGDACHWGFCELYPESEKVLREAIEKKMQFDTGWVGCKKEIESFHLVSDGENILIETHAEMDDLPGLIYDAVWDVYNEELEVTEEQIEEITDIWCWSMDCSTECGEGAEIPLTTYEAVIEELVRQEEANAGTLDRWFETMKNIVRDVFEREP